MADEKDRGNWTLVPASLQEIEMLRKKCRRMVLRRAAVSAGAAAVPIPGIDIATDLGLLVKLIEDINAEFGLTPGQISRLRPEVRLVVYQAMVGMSSMLVGKLVTREVVAQVLQRTGMRLLVKYSAKIVPVAGQAVSAAIGFAAFRTIGNQHVDACAKVAGELLEPREAK